MEQVTVEVAIEQILANTTPVERVEFVSLEELGGRILAQDVYAPISNPPFDRAPIDGYALRAEDTKGATKETPVSFRVLTEVDAGHMTDLSVSSHEAVRIMTGAPIPKGCNCCIRQEDTDYGEDTVAVYKEMKVHENYCDLGEDIKKGALLLQKGTKLSFAELGILASVGIISVMVYEKPRIALITTGDEVTEPGMPLGRGKIYNSNLTMLTARLKELGYPFTVILTAVDDAQSLATEVEQIADKVDLLVTTGGVSVGKKDILHETIRLLDAKRIFWKVLLKPGTPTIFWCHKKLPVLSLSGNPFGALTNAELLLRPLLAKMAQDPSLLPVTKTAVMADEFLKESKGRRYIRARYENGHVTLPRGLHSSGVLSSMLGCNCLIDIKPGTKALNKGDEVNVVLL